MLCKRNNSLVNMRNSISHIILRFFLCVSDWYRLFNNCILKPSRHGDANHVYSTKRTNLCSKTVSIRNSRNSDNNFLPLSIKMTSCYCQIGIETSQARPCHLECSEYVIPKVLRVFNHLNAKLISLNFHPLEVVPRYRDPQLQVGENCSYLFILSPNKGLFAQLDV